VTVENLTYPSGFPRTVVESQIRLLSQQVSDRVKWLINQASTPYTQNYHSFSRYREKYLTRYKSERSVSFITLSMALRTTSRGLQQKPDTGIRINDGDDLENALRLLRTLGYDVGKAADLERLRPVDPYEQEIIVAAEVRAYFQIAYKVSSPNSPQ